MDKNTSWNKVASWYDQLVSDEGSDFHQNLILPGAIRILKPKPNEKILDIGCGQGVFCRKLLSLKADVTGIDASPKLIKLAKERSPGIKYFVLDATNLQMFENNSFDLVTCILALQNMDPLSQIIKETSRVLRPNGAFFFVINHPCFRIPRQSGWGFDEKRKLQYRRIDSYMSSNKIPIQMHPGSAPNVHTWTFHRPLSEYFKELNSNGFCVSHLEEWTSHRRSKQGKSSRLENRSREEFPLFMAIMAVKAPFYA